MNGKTYYGSSLNCGRRWQEHKSALRNNKHHNIHLQRAWNLYGESNFRFQILESLPCEDLVMAEQQYLDFAKILPTLCYNIATETEHTVRGIKWSDESREKLSNSKIGTKLSPDTKRKMSVAHKGLNTWTSGKPANNRDKTIYTFVNTVTNEIFSGIRLDFQQRYNLSQGNLGSVIRGERNSHKNWVIKERRFV